PGDAVDGVTFGHRLLDRVADDAARRLVLGELRDAACVALLTRERRGDEAVDEGDRLLDGVLARADRDDIGVVVLARELRGREVPAERGPHALDLVGGDLLAVARSAEHDAERLPSRALVAHDGTRRVDAEAGVVVQRVVALGPVVDHLVPGVAEMLLQGLTELESGVVGRDVDAHPPSLRGPTRHAARCQPPASARPDLWPLRARRSTIGR